jgi:uncharacterized protein (UPF0248 family)
MVHPLKNILNKLRWDASENAEDYRISYRHRGAPGDMKELTASSIVKLGKSYFTTGDLTATGEETLIPFHRILEVCNKKRGIVVWKKRTK